MVETVFRWWVDGLVRGRWVVRHDDGGGGGGSDGSGGIARAVRSC